MTIFYNIMESDANMDADRNAVCVMEFVNNHARAIAYATRCNRSQGKTPKYKFTITRTKTTSE